MSIEEMILKLKEKSIIVEELIAYFSSKKSIKYIIMNAAGDEPLLKVSHALMTNYPYETLKGFSIVMDIFGMKEGIVALKEINKEAINSFEGDLELFKGIRLEKIKDAYSLWDNEVLAKEILKNRLENNRNMQKTNLKFDSMKEEAEINKEDILVIDIETCLDIYNAIIKGEVVTETFLTVGGAIEKSLTIKAPLGVKVKDILAKIGEIKVKDYMILIGGPMRGKIGTKESVITKDTKGILILPKFKKVCQSRKGDYSKFKKQALSTCSQCKMCTMLCPRYQLGYDIQPHKIMNTIIYGGDYLNLMGVFSCSQCNLCTLYSCPQDLNPMMIIRNLKIKLKEKGLDKLYESQYLSRYKTIKTKVNQRGISDKLLKQRLGLVEYDKEAPLEHFEFISNNYYIDLNNRKGIKYSPDVKIGDKVLKGQGIAQYTYNKITKNYEDSECSGDSKKNENGEVLKIALYSPVSGKVLEISEKYIFIKKGEF